MAQAWPATSSTLRHMAVLTTDKLSSTSIYQVGGKKRPKAGR